MHRASYRVTHVILDVDGTLVDFEAAMWHALRVTAEYASEVTGTLITAEHLQAARDAVAAEPAWQGRPLLDLRVEAYRRLLGIAGVDDPAAPIELSRRFVEAREAVLIVYPDAAEALPALHARGFTLVAATNGNVFLEEREIARYLHHIHRADDVGYSKPDPRFFATALQATGGRPERAITVGDRLDNDIDPARALGMPGILIDRDRAVQDPSVHRISALTELLDLLELADDVHSDPVS
jgi:HAD superfamily hydrolase (TIGR01509 family)